MVDYIGKTPTNPPLFYSGKIAGYIVWVLLLISLLSMRSISEINQQRWIALIILCFGLVFTVVSLINLGKSNRLGIPREDTELKTHGLYKISRNPMYLGFNMLTLSAILFIGNFVVLVFGIYSIYVYHRIILSEEKFLESRFADQYSAYKKNVRRYI